MINVTVRPAASEDVPYLLELYREALAEQVELREAWGVAEGLAEPLDTTIAELMADADSFFLVGEVDGVTFGFIWGRIERLLPQAGDERIGVVRLVYVDPAMRAVGIGEALLEAVLVSMRAKGIRRFDAIVSPGHRLAKNFFESAGFSARRITMYHRDEDQA